MQEASLVETLRNLAVMAFVLAMAFRTYRTIRAFGRLGADHVDRARTLSELGLRDSRYLKRLKKRRVVLTTADGRLHLDRARWSEYVRTRLRRIGLVMLVILVLVLCYLWVSGRP